MKQNTASFNLRAWRLRLGWTQKRAAEETGLSESAYRAAEYKAMDREGAPCALPLAKLCAYLEDEHAPMV